jgi:YesN/AraC family two-component response regulator
VISINGRKLCFSPMTIMALSDKDSIDIHKSSNLNMNAVFFNPIIINSSLSINNIFNVDHEQFDETTRSDLSILKYFLADNIQKKAFQVTEIIGMQILLLFDRIECETSSRNNDFWLFSVRLHTCQLLYLLTKIENKDPLPIIEISDTPRDVEKIVFYLHTYFHTQITLNALAHEFRTNRTTISNNFKKTFKMTIMVYLTKIRIQAAALLLRNTNLSVFEIASQTGFVDLPHFSRTFKKHWNYTPGDFRQSFNHEISEPSIGKTFQLTYTDYISTKF